MGWVLTGVVGTFPVFDNLKPKIVRVEFAPLPVNHKDMVAAIKDNGKLQCCRLWLSG